MIHRVRWADKPGIVYAATRKAAEEISRALEKEGVEALFYHGGLARKEREEVHEQFMSGRAEAIVATNAFGMGVDKPDIRFVYHYDASGSLDEYYQEIGRAGRDGKKAEAVLFFRREDIGALSYKTGEGKIDPAMLELLATRLAGQGDPEAVAGELGLSGRKLASALQRLEDAGAAEVLSTGEVRVPAGVDLAGAAQAAAEEHERQIEAKRERLEQMRAYANVSTCRRELLLQYLGDNFQGPCNFCDNCGATEGGLVFDPSAGTRREVV